MSSTTSSDLPSEIVLLQMSAGYWLSQALYVAAKLSLADYLKDGAQSVHQLAEQTGTNPRALYRLLRALASFKVFAETEAGQFCLTPLANLLRSDVANSLRGAVVMNGEEHYQAWGDLLYSVQTGDSAFEKQYQMPIFQYLDQHPAAAETFDAAMTSYSTTETSAILASYDFSGFQTLVDVAGGQGSLLSAILQATPTLKGILFDLPAVIARAKPDPAVMNRCELMAGSFFEALPAGADAYLFKHIIHDWDDQQSVRILQTCRRAMAPHSRLLLCEQVIPSGNQPFFGKMLDLNMLVMCSGGCERTAEEYQTLLQQAGFELTRIVDTPSTIHVVEGRPM